MYIHIFKTNIETDNAYNHVSSVLSSHPLIINWHIDKEDVDKVLRIESKTNNHTEIISSITQAGFICKELED